MRVAVTRAEGVLGLHLVARAIAAGHEVVAIVGPRADPPRRRLLTSIGPGVDVRDERDDVAWLLEGCTVLIDMKARAAELGPDAAFARADPTTTLRLLDAAATAGVTRTVLLSSLAVHRFDGSTDVDVRTRPRDRRELPYAQALRGIEDLVLRHARMDGVVVRPGLWPVGPSDPVLWRLARALRGGRLPLVGGGQGVLNLVDAEELADGLLAAALHPNAVGRVFAMADPTPLTWREVLTTLASLLGGRPPRRLLPNAPAQAVAAVLERAYGAAVPTSEPTLTRYRTALLGTGLHVRVDAAERELGWRTEVPWREALRRVAVDALGRMGVAPRGRT
jgi:nucleoside-diphosphate-sugar epimerase